MNERTLPTITRSKMSINERKIDRVQTSFLDFVSATRLWRETEQGRAFIFGSKMTKKSIDFQRKKDCHLNISY